MAPALRVRVSRDGKPLRGARVAAGFPGAHGETTSPTPECRTNEDGLARFDGLPGTLGLVLVWPGDGPHASPMAFDRVDLAKSDDPIDVDFGLLVRATVDLTVDGRRAIPDGFELEPRNWITADHRIFACEIAVCEWIEDAALGRVRFSLLTRSRWAAYPLPVDGVFRGAGGMRVPFEWPLRPGQKSIDAEVAFGRPCAVDVAIVPPSDGKFSWKLERRSVMRASEGAEELDVRWIDHWPPWVLSGGRGSDERRSTVTDLPPGTYRLTDEWTGITSDEIDLRTTGSRAAVTLDLSPIFVQTVRLLVPPDTRVDPRMVRARFADSRPTAGFHLDDADGGPQWSDQPECSSCIDLRLVRGHRATVFARWPGLVASKTRGSVVVDEPGPLVTLELVHGHRVEWQVPRHATDEVVRYEQPPEVGTVTLRGVSGPAASEPVFEFTSDAEAEQKMRTFGFVTNDAGDFDATFTLDGFLPLTRRISIAAGTTKLGQIRLTPR